MSNDPAKDFDAIADDYVFFEHHATEAREDARAYYEQLAGILPPDAALSMLDFGCGSGTFTERLLEQTGWPPDRLRLTLVEPAEAVRREAVARLARFTTAPLSESSTLPTGVDGQFNLVLSNHVLYYVPELQQTLSRLIAALAPTGVLLTAIAARSNALIKFWIAGFGLLGREVPYNTSEDVEIALGALGVNCEKRAVPYELTFPDTEDNRLRIIRFLLADHLAEMPFPPLIALFDKYSHAGRIEIHTDSDHFTVRPRFTNP